MYILKKLNEEKHVKTKELADRYIAEGYCLIEPEKKTANTRKPEPGGAVGEQQPPKK